MERNGVPGALPVPCTPGYSVDDVVAELDEIPQVGGVEAIVEPPPHPPAEPGGHEVAVGGDVDD
eukprot:2287893-Prorocentrum_lima.AAC.1